jgi:hypothetical protein
MLYEKTLEAPFIPKCGDNFDKKYCEMPERIGNETKERYEKYFQNESYFIVFNEFTCYKTETIDYINNNTINNLNTITSVNEMGSIKKMNPQMIKTKSNYTLKGGKTQMESAVEKIKNVKVFLSNMNLNKNIGTNIPNTNIPSTSKANIKPDNNNTKNLLGISTNKLAFNSALILEKSSAIKSLNITGSINKTINPFNKISSLATPELKKNSNSLQNSLNFNTNLNNTNSISNSHNKYTTNLILSKNKATNSTINTLVKQINQLSISTNTNNSSNSNTSNITTNHKIQQREKRTNSLMAIASPTADINMIYKSKDAYVRSNSNFNTNAFENGMRSKKNSCDVNIKEYEKFKTNKMIQKNLISNSSSLNLKMNSHIRDNSNSNLNSKFLGGVAK